MPKSPKAGLDPIKIFLHAGAFHKSYTLLCDSVLPAEEWAMPDEQRVGVISHPAMVLSVFASELYLKCLLCIETGVVPTEHNLKKLFDGLLLATKRELDDFWDTDIRHPAKRKTIEHIRTLPTGRDLKLDLRYALDVGADSFRELRYFYETEQTFFLLAHFPFVVRRVILNRFPSWGSLLPKPSKGFIGGSA
jgi:hypothetical protein